MRIRKRSGASFTSSWSPTSCVAISTDNGNGDGEEAEFLLPLVAAAMDVQRSEEEEKVEGDGDHCTRATAFRTHARPVHNWRNALQLQRGGDGNSENQALEDGGEGKKVERKWKGNMRNQWESIRLLKKEGTQGTLDTSSSAEKEITGDIDDEEWELPKSGLLDRGNLGRHEKKSSVHSNKGKRSKDEIGYFKGWKDDETKTTKKLKQEIQLEDGRRMDEKAMPNKRSNNNNNNEAEGSQCRRRNGRGWRCSQRTLVGYSLCEHHLAKGRLRNINSNANNNTIGTGIVINKVSNCKIKELRLINTSCSRSAEAELTNKL